MFACGVIQFGFLAIFFINASALSDEHKAHMKEKFIEIGEGCLKDHPISQEDLESLGGGVVPKDDNASCFAACAFNSLGLFDDKGALVDVETFDKSEKIFENEEEISSIRQFLQTCAKINEEEVSDGEKGCERAKLTFNCFADNHDAIPFDISFV